MTVEKTCSIADCDYPDFACHMGYSNVAECPHVKAPKNVDAGSVVTEAEMLFPWTGRAFGLNDLRFVSACARPHLVGIVGPENAGKTTLLGVLFLMLLRGVTLKSDWQFAGSYTLEGWGSIARWMQLRPGFPPRFPPHTPSNAQRQPGMLHLAFQTASDRIRDVLLTDAPGEWFSAWTVDEAAVSAEGARWVAKHADRFLLIADSAALSGPETGKSRMTLKFLTRRLAAATEGCRVALVWTKTDMERPQKLIDDVESTFRQHFPDGPVFSVQVPAKVSEAGLADLDALVAAYAWAMDDATSARQLTVAVAASSLIEDAFSNYGRQGSS